jgi:hypothetical protein
MNPDKLHEILEDLRTLVSPPTNHGEMAATRALIDTEPATM